MATKQNNAQITAKNEGEKIALEQQDYKLIFGDDDLSIRCDKYQREYPVNLDICANKDNNLVIGVGEDCRYVAQVEIPAIVYTETVGEDGETARQAQPLDMGDVAITLWAI